VEPVPVTSKVRRTVRVAVALVVGQALLCTLIGWLTLSQSRPAGSGPGASAVDQLAAPPPVAPGPPVVGTTTSAAPSSSYSSAPVRRKRTSAAVDAPAPPRATTGAPTPPSPEPIGLPPEPPAASSSAPAPPLPPTVAPSSAVTTPPTGLIRAPVTIGDRCRPEGAFGRTAEGALVRCVAERHRRPRWKIV
jgi:hypothetical protein